MQLRHGKPLLSASDLVAFHECGHLTQLDRRAIGDASLFAERCAADEQALLIQAKGNEFEAHYLARLEREYPGQVVRIEKGVQHSLEELAAQTLVAMHAGAPIVYQATFLQDDLLGHADFLRRVERPSSLGDWSYEVIDTKLARSEKPKFVLQLAFYSEMLAVAQGAEPQTMHVVLGSGEEVSYRCADYSRYFRRLLRRFRTALAQQPPKSTYPDPCERCSLCHWRERCEAQRERDDSLWLVADIRTSQVRKLQAAGIDTLTQLARLPAAHAVPKLATESRAKLRAQAALQLAGRASETVLHEWLPAEPGRGLARIPAPHPGDVYFDMEGDPLQEGGLEYLFGVLYRDDDDKSTEWQFRAFWAHGRDEERLAYEQFMDWLSARIARHPALHVYHYASYENTALKRLAGLHGTREDALDALLREGRLVDLYRVVREGLRVSTPSYSIKYVERLYRPARAGEVQTAGASIVWYERYLQTREAKLLEAIERYNEDDCRSLQQLHAWLLQQRPDSTASIPAEQPPSAAAREPSEKLQQYLDTVAELRAQLLATIPADPAERQPADHARELLADLLEFHRRADKPQWWAMFARADLELDELIDDRDAIGGLERVPGSAREYTYPPQEHRFASGDSAVWVGHPQMATVKIESLDEERRRMILRPSKKSGPLPERLSLGDTGPISNGVLRDAVLRVARSIVASDQRFAALAGFLEKRLPRLAGRAPGTPVAADASAPMAQIIEAVAALERSHLFIQGPPGAGKTYTGSHLIVELLARGQRVAVSSNSHKAINNLLRAVDELMVERELTGIRAVKKSDERRPDTFSNGERIADVTENDDALDPDNQLRRRHRVAVREARGRAVLRLPVRRRGRPGLARPPARDGHLRAQPRAARRPDAARPADPGHAPRPLGRVGARVPARRPRDGTAGHRRVPAHDLAHVPGRMPVHL